MFYVRTKLRTKVVTMHQLAALVTDLGYDDKWSLYTGRMEEKVVIEKPVLISLRSLQNFIALLLELTTITYCDTAPFLTLVLYSLNSICTG
jgi:hypothetical protein